MPLSQMPHRDLCNLIDTLGLSVSKGVGGTKRRTKQHMADEIMEEIGEMIADGRAKVVLNDENEKKNGKADQHYEKAEHVDKDGDKGNVNVTVNVSSSSSTVVDRKF